MKQVRQRRQILYNFIHMWSIKTKTNKAKEHVDTEDIVEVIRGEGAGVKQLCKGVNSMVKDGN